jgi:hypothetical protein
MCFYKLDEQWTRGRGKSTGRMKLFHRLTSMPYPVLDTGTETLHMLLLCVPCASLRSPPVRTPLKGQTYTPYPRAVTGASCAVTQYRLQLNPAGGWILVFLTGAGSLEICLYWLWAPWQTPEFPVPPLARAKNKQLVRARDGMGRRSAGCRGGGLPAAQASPRTRARRLKKSSGPIRRIPHTPTTHK